MLAHALGMPASSSPLLLHKWSQCGLSAPIAGEGLFVYCCSPKSTSGHTQVLHPCLHLSDGTNKAYGQKNHKFFNTGDVQRARIINPVIELVVNGIAGPDSSPLLVSKPFVRGYQSPSH